MGAIEKISLQPRDKVLLSDKEGWQEIIMDEIRFHEPVFCRLSENLDAMAKAIIPLNLRDQRFINNLEDQHFFKQNSITPSNRAMAICDNKEKFSEYLEKRNFGEYLPRLAVNEPPYILKPKSGQWGEDIHIIRTKSEEEKVTTLLNNPSYFKQELIAGSEEYTTHFLFHKKFYFFRTYAFGYDNDFPVKGVETKYKYRRLTNHHYLKPLFESIINTLDYQGFGCFNYKLTDDQPKIFEMNPRFGASLCNMIDDAIEAYIFAIFERKFGLI